MAEKTVYIVQQFERQGRKLIQGRQMVFPTAGEAELRAERDAERVAGVIAVAQTVDSETGEIIDEPRILVHYGQVPSELVDD